MEQTTHQITTINTVHPLIQAGDIYKHYKGNLYQIICISCHSEDLTWYVVYKTLYDNKVSTIWHRPLDMFLGTLEIDGKQVQRFEKIT